MLPDMLAQPYAAHRPHAVARGVHGGRATPEVGVVVGHPTVSAVIQLCRFGSVLRQVFDQVEQRGSTFRKVGDLGRPVVHLGVDVEGIFTAPVGQQVLKPASLEIGGLAALPAAGDSDIPAELEELGLEVGIRLALLEGVDTYIRGLFVLCAITDCEMDAAHQAGEVLEVRLLELLVALALDSSEDLLAASRRIAADVLVIDQVCGYCKDESH